MRCTPHFQLFYFYDKYKFGDFFEWKIKTINNGDLFAQTPLIMFTKGANISGGHRIYIKQNKNMLKYTILENMMQNIK